MEFRSIYNNALLLKHMFIYTLRVFSCGRMGAAGGNSKLKHACIYKFVVYFLVETVFTPF